VEEIKKEKNILVLDIFVVSAFLKFGLVFDILN